MNIFSKDVFIKSPNNLYSSNSYGSFRVLDYKDSLHIRIMFVDTGYVCVVNSGNIRKGRVKDLLKPVICGVAYLGDGAYTASTDGIPNNCYKTFYSMHSRCYSYKIGTKNPTYAECSVCPEWNDFQNFAKWYDKNYIYGYALDKDILIQGNRIYSPRSCIFIPPNINNLFVSCNSKRGKYMLGVHRHNNKGKFIAQCRDGSNSVHYIGSFNSELEAHNEYKKYKYQVIKQVAETCTEGVLKEALLSWVIPLY